jgi:hypothetical protein
MMIKNGLAAALVLAALLAVASTQAVECPKPQLTSRPGVIPESAVKIDDLSALLESGDDANRIRVLVQNLRQNYPAAENGEIVNYLVAAFCPMVNQLNGLGDAEKQGRIDAFTRQVVSLVY